MKSLFLGNSNLLFAHGTNFLLQQPLFDALAVVDVLALQRIDLLFLLHILVADRTHLLLMLFARRYLLEFIHLLL